MRNIDFNKYQSALIIGNGFDLSLGLSTSYMDFVNSDEFQILLNMQNQLAIYLKVNAELQNWIDIENELNLKKDELKEEIRKQIIQNIILFVIFLIIAIITLALISNKIYKILKNYKKQVIENEKELKVLNKSLEEMISNIAHISFFRVL